MGQDVKGDHLQLMKNVNQSVEDFVVEGLTESFPKNRKSAFTRDMFQRDAGISAISPSSILITQNAEEMAHILMAVDMTKKVEEE